MSCTGGRHNRFPSGDLTSSLKASRNSLHPSPHAAQYSERTDTPGCKKAVRGAAASFSWTRYGSNTTARHPPAGHTHRTKTMCQVLIPATTTILQNSSSLTPAGWGTKPQGLLWYISIATKRLKQTHCPGSGSTHVHSFLYPKLVLSSYLKGTANAFGYRRCSLPRTAYLLQSHHANCMQRDPALTSLGYVY